MTANNVGRFIKRNSRLVLQAGGKGRRLMAAAKQPPLGWSAYHPKWCKSRSLAKGRYR